MIVSSMRLSAYGVEICFSPSASKNFYSVHRQPLVRVEGMVSMAQYICKGRGHGFRTKKIDSAHVDLIIISKHISACLCNQNEIVEVLARLKFGVGSSDERANLQSRQRTAVLRVHPWWT